MYRLRVAVIGCGRMGRERLRSSRAWGAEIAGVYDPDLQRANDAGASVFHDPDDVRKAGCDAVFLCTPPNQRNSYALAAIDAGSALFVEKPIGPSAATAGAVTAALSGHSVPTAVGYMNRYRRSVQHAAHLLTRHQVLGVSGTWVCRSYGVPWWQDVSASGGPHNEQATHLYDLCRYLIGEVREVRSLFQDPGTASPPLAAATVLQFESGALGTLLYSCQASGKDIGFRIFTTAGSLAFSGWDLQLTENTIDGTFADAADPEDIFLTETSAFLDAVSSGDTSTIRCDWFDAVRTQKLVDAAADSLTGGAAHAG